jgi:20S proteasome alpha/beta subunit
MRLLIVSLLLLFELAFSDLYKFNSEGRISQLELAKKASENGNPVFCVRTNAMIVICTCDVVSSLSAPMEKIVPISNFLILCGSGIATDFSYLKDQITSEILEQEFNLRTEVSALRLAKKLSNIIHSQTLTARTRPLGASILLAGKHNEQLKLYEINCLGNIYDNDATCIGLYSEPIISKWSTFHAEDIAKWTEEELLARMKQCMEDSMYSHDEFRKQSPLKFHSQLIRKSKDFQAKK